MFLIGCVTLMMTGFAVIIPVFPQRLQALGLGSETLALMEGALAGFIVTNLLLAFVNVPLLFVPIRFVEGMLLSGLIPAAMSMVGDTIPLSRQGRWIGFLTTAQAVGFALGPGLGGLLSQTFGFTSPFLLSAGIALVASLLALFLVPETLPAHMQLEARAQQVKVKREGKGQQYKEWSMARLTWLVAPFLIIDFGMIFTFPFVAPQLPFFFGKVLHYSPAQYGVLFSVYSIALAIFPLMLGRLSETLPKKPLIVIGSLLFSILFLLVTPFYPLLLTGAALAGLGSAFVELDNTSEHLPRRLRQCDSAHVVSLRSGRTHPRLR